MDENLEYKKLYFCHTCRKYLSFEFYESHKSLKHNVNVYLGAPTKKGVEDHQKDEKDAQGEDWGDLQTL